MPTHAENIKKNDDALKKAQAVHRAKEKKYIEIEVRRLIKILHKTSYFKKNLTDEKLLSIMKEAFGSTSSETSNEAVEAVEEG